MHRIRGFVTAVATPLLAVVLGLHLNVHAATFYLSSSAGNDTLNSARSEQDPWRSIEHLIDKLEDDVVNDGDVVLLKRGDVFRKDKYFQGSYLQNAWQIRKAITLGAYGDASLARPVLSGGMPVTGWEVYRGNVWVADAPDTPAMLYVNRELMLFARYPNSGFLRRNNTDNDDAFICEELRNHPRNADGYWVGANARWRLHNWWWGGKKRITGYDAATGRITCEGNAKPGETYGFYVDKKLEELDSAGEWHFDVENMKVYLYAPGGVDPNTVEVVGTVYRGAGMKLTADGIRMEDLCFRYFHGDRTLAVTARADITRCLFECLGSDEGKFGLHGRAGAAGSRITHCMFRNMVCVAIEWSNGTEPGAPRTLFEFDTLTNIMTVPAYGFQGRQNWSNTAFVVNANSRNVNVRHCYFGHNAYAGILNAGVHDTIEYNIFDDCMCILNDGAAIYTYCDSSVIRNNLVLNTRGCAKECGQGDAFSANIAQGIWPEFLEDFSGMVIENNTVVNSGCLGLFFRDNFNGTVRNNVFYGNNIDQIRVSQKKTGCNTDRTDWMPMNHRIENNVFVSTSAAQNSFTYKANPRADGTNEEKALDREYDLDIGVIRDNHYCNPYSDTLVARTIPGRDRRLTLADWASDLTCADPTPRTDPIKRPADAAENDPTGTTRIIINDQLTRRTIALDNGVYLTKDADTVIGAVTLDPYTSIVLWHTGGIASAHPYRAPIAELTAFRASGGGRLSLHTSLSRQASMRIRVYALSGRLVSEKTYRLRAGTHDLPVMDACKATACGFYHCEAILSTGDARQEVRSKVMVMR